MNGLLAATDDLIAFAWSAPMRDLAAKVGISDVGLKKLLTSHGVPLPKQGHWNRVHAGQKAPERPRAPPRSPGHSDRVLLDARFAGLIPSSPPPGAEGPFASALVPEDLDELRERELKTLGRVGTPRSLEQPHEGLTRLLAKEARRREKDTRPYNFEKPLFDGPLDQRRLRLLNGLFRALERRGHDGEAWEQGSGMDARAIVGTTTMHIALEPVSRQRTVLVHGYHRLAPDLPAKTPLRLAINDGHGRAPICEWRDEDGRPLEKMMAEITAGVIVAGEAAYRRRLREAAERREQRRVEERIERERRRAELDRQRLADLRRSGELLREAEDIRILIARVKAAATREAGAATSEELDAWERWALGQADRIDPIRSGQFLSHLRSPEPP